MIEEELRAKVEKYIRLEEEALSRIRISVPENSFLMGYAKDILNMANSYFSDAKHFMNKGDLINALSCLNYSYGWIDSGIRIGVIDGGSDYRLSNGAKAGKGA